MKKRNRIIYWVATVWLALGMLSTGIVQLLRAKEGQGGADMITHLGYPLYFLTIVGAWKIVGVAALLIGKNSLLKEWAYAGFFFLMTGALFSHVLSGDRLTESLPSLLLLVLTLMSWYFRPEGRRVVLAQN
jgi:hypothetical protein